MSTTTEEGRYLTWTLPESSGIDSLTLQTDAPTKSLGDDEVAVELHAASLNYRELVVVKVSSMAQHRHGSN